ncbi:TetR/AcrR family transcriptional regulator [Mycobacteroides sp. LB1]|uniref:TetR/AcrR family transcriptional regulator n=1 Tax=Mycobacteroides sp. LB1 TaxID=2750814 RepID=UPI0015DF51E9|nr:TetR/AcrR family transcriptional regulator [Mycobacteroides sp. LB1]
MRGVTDSEGVDSTSAGRRTQAQRRAETRAKLIDAAIASVLEVGYSKTTVRRISDLAGVSSGGSRHFFPRKIDLVVEALEYSIRQRTAAVRESLDVLPITEPERAEAVLDLVWKDYTDPLFEFGLKLWVTAADDPELRKRLLPATELIVSSFGEIFVKALGEQTVAVENIALRTSLALNAIRGIVFARAFEPRQLHMTGNDWPAIRAELVQLLLR